MPRVENLGDNVQAWCERSGRESGSTRDVCAACYARLEAAPHAFDGRLAPTHAGEPLGDGGWGGTVDHPPYAYANASCAVCGVRLTALDDGRSLDCCSTASAATRAHVPCVAVTRRRVQ